MTTKKKAVKKITKPAKKAVKASSKKAAPKKSIKTVKPALNA
jgi:hypothetical protein